MKAGSEAAFQQQVEQLARFHGWRIFHAPDNRPGKTGRKQKVAPGFPDLVLIRPPELIFAELKTDTGRLRPAQLDWIADLSALSTAVRNAVDQAVDQVPAVDVYIWRPADFDAMHARLARGRVRHQPLYQTGDAA